VETNRSAVGSGFGRRHPGSGQAGRQGAPPFGGDRMKKSRVSARASQPDSRQVGGQNGSWWTSLGTGGNQGNGAIAPASLWQAGA
jgi:hypothetical protein